MIGVRCDVSDMASCVQAQEEVAAAFPDAKIGMLFNNAGIMGQGGVGIINGPTTEDAWKPLFNVNLFGAVNM